MERLNDLIGPSSLGESMDALDYAVFELISSDAPHPFSLWLASVLAEHSGWACAAILAWVAWRQRGERLRVLAILVVAAVVSVISKEIAQTLGMARPFMLELSPQYIDHGARPGLPSTHACVLYAVAFLMLARRQLRNAGWLVLGIASATAWARVYVGVHFPLDIVAGAALAALLAITCCALRRALPSGWRSRRESAQRSNASGEYALKESASRSHAKRRHQ